MTPRLARLEGCRLRARSRYEGKEAAGDRDDFRQKSSGKNDTLPTMESNHKYRDGDGKRYTAKKEGHRLAGGERGPLSRCLFAIRPFFTITRRPLGKGTYMRSDRRSHQARSSIA